MRRARVAALVGLGEIPYSAPSAIWWLAPPIRLEGRGSRELKGAPGCWEIFAVVS